MRRALREAAPAKCVCALLLLLGTYCCVRVWWPDWQPGKITVNGPVLGRSSSSRRHVVTNNDTKFSYKGGHSFAFSVVGVPCCPPVAEFLVVHGTQHGAVAFATAEPSLTRVFRRVGELV